MSKRSQQQTRRERTIVKHMLPRAALYDIGVGLKSEYLTLKKVLPGLRVFGCEPNPTTYARIKARFPGPLWPVAIAETAEPVTLHIVPGRPEDTSACLPPTGHAAQAQTWTLDEFDEQCGKQDNVILWMDVEGMELQALRSGKALMSSGRVRWVNVEVRNSDEIATARGARWSKPTAVRELLERLGYVFARSYNRWKGHHDEIYVHGDGTQ